MIPAELLRSNEPDVLRAALRQMDAQLTVAFRLLTTLTKQLEKLGGKDVTQLALDSVNSAEVAPLPPRIDGLNGTDLATQGTPAEPPTPETPETPETPQTPEPPAPRKSRPGHGPKKQRALEKTERVYELDPADCPCANCGRLRKPMSGQYESSEMIDVVEMKVELVTVKRAKYGCNCGAPIETAIGPTRSTPGGRYSLSFAIHIAVQKYLYHMPLERQVRWLRDRGLEVSSQVLWDQLHALLDYVKPTVEAIRRAILSEPVIGVDQTGWKDLRRRTAKLKQLWGIGTKSLRYYQICDCKGLESFEKVLGPYQGTIVCDEASTHGAAARRNPLITLAACWAHVLRKFREARKAFTEAAAPMRSIKRLYELDGAASSPEERRQIRATESKATIESLKTWLDARAAMPKGTSLGAAIQYAINAWAHLTHFLTDERVWLDNNLTESQLRGPVVGRKNHYGSKSARGTAVAGAFYTILESAKLAGVPAAGYLRAIVEAATAYENGGGPVVLLPADYARTLTTLS